MKFDRWINQDHPPVEWVAKLMEEVGEVADALLDVEIRRVPKVDHLVEELEHVEFIARCWRHQLEREVR